MATRRRRDVETNNVGSAEAGGASEARSAVIADGLTTSRDLASADSAGGDWRRLALCLQFNGDMWFPERGESPAAAKLLCGRCDVRAECLEFALDTNEDYGIWGGLSTAERKALRRRRRLRRALDRAGIALPFELDEPGCGLSAPDGEAA
jgi:WhiB family redox-sensing transcriptional regulator